MLVFLYLGYIALRAAIEHQQSAARAAAILAIVGVINIPIIHFSVEWWNSLHQPATITRTGGSTMHESMRSALFTMVAGFQLLYGYFLLLRMRTGILQRDMRTRWVAELVSEGKL